MTDSGIRIGGRVVIPPSDPALKAALKLVSRLLGLGEVDQALRELDRITRTSPQYRLQLLPVLGHFLLKYQQNFNLALKLLLQAAELQSSADIEADVIQCWLALGSVDAARRRLTPALTRYAVAPGDALADAARALIQRSPVDLGFVLLGPDLCLRAEVPSRDVVVFELRSADGNLLAQVTKRQGAIKRSRLAVPRIDKKQFVVVTANGRPLLGGQRIFPVAFRVDGRSTESGDWLEGWLQMGWNPASAVELKISDELGNHRTISATRSGVQSRWHYRLNVRKAGLGNRLHLRALLPDGASSELADSPLLLKSEALASLKRIRPKRTALSRVPARAGFPGIAIVIPVYQGHEETLACIGSVYRTVRGEDVQIVVIDDASPDPALVADLDALAACGRIELLRNDVNLGFAGSVNRAMAYIADKDAVLVNADALVFDGWLPRLKTAAYASADIGSVTPFSDDDSIAGFCDVRDASVDVLLVEAMDQFAAESFSGQAVELPVGVGFCMYVRRACWLDTGRFDESAFSQGYGEESDWCMRARKRGWRHVLAADVVVHHAGGRSFGDRRAALQERAMRLMNIRHPGYDRYIGQFFAEDPLSSLRRGFDSYRLCTEDRPLVLLLMLALPGGVDRFVNERCQRIRDQGKVPVLLRPLEMGPDQCTLWCTEPRTTRLQFNIPSELKELQELLKVLPIESIELHHFLGLDSRLVKSALNLGVPFDVYLHDYSWICPRITLMGDSDQYCGEPALPECERCIERNGSDLMESISVASLRRRTKLWLRGARKVIAPSSDTARRYRRYLPDAVIEVEPLEEVSPSMRKLARLVKKSRRVVLLGGIGKHKGYDVLLECARDARARCLDLEFVVVGYTGNDNALLKTGKVFITGQYRDSEVPDLLKREDPDLIWLPSVWPETWCYTLTHALLYGAPVLAFDIGAVADRLRDSGCGELLPLGMPAHEINDRLLTVVRSAVDA